MALPRPWIASTALFAVVACQAASRPRPLAPRPILASPPNTVSAVVPVASASVPAPAPAAARPAAHSDVPATDSRPILFEAAAPDGSWVLFCEAARDTNEDGKLEVSVGVRGELGGDALDRRLVLASGIDRVVDDVLATSEDGRRLIALDGGRLSLFETGGAPERTLTLTGADLGREPGVRSGHRAIALSDRSIFYVRSARARSELVVQDLATSAERVEYAGPEAIVRLELYEQGAVVVLRIAGADTNGNGRLDWPFTPIAESRPCVGPIPTFRAARAGADALGAVVLDRRIGAARRVDDLVLPFGSGLLRRGGDGTLAIDRAGKSRVIGDATCAGRVLFADPIRDQALIGCSDPKRPGRFFVELVGGTRLPLGVDIAALGFDEPLAPKRRTVALYPGADTMLFDLEHRQLHALRPGDAVLHSSGTRALIRRGNALVVFDLASGSEFPLAGTLDPFGGLLIQGDLVYVSPLVIDLRAGVTLGQVPGPGLALARSGAVLVPKEPASAERLARGPLRWQMP